MKLRILALSLAGLAAAIVPVAMNADTPGHHPAYLHARSDLRRAQFLLRVREEPNVTRRLIEADHEVEAAIGEIERGGIYSRIRHPRYLASFLAILGACLLAGTRIMYLAAAVWLALMAVIIVLEEREMRSRFGATYRDYSRKVPRFIPRWESRN